MKIIEQTWNELNLKDSVVIVGIAPIEEHGKHMPLGVDYYLTEKWIEGVGDKLNTINDINVYTLPTIALGSADISGFPGNLYVSQALVYQITKEILLSIYNWGIKSIIVISGHADPKHLIAIEQACDYVNKKKGIVAISPMGAIFSDGKTGVSINHNEKVKTQLGKYPNDFHAGWIETSMMMYYDKVKVRDEYKNAVDIEVKPKEMAQPKLVNEKIAGVGHIGYPRFASEELGEKLHEDMVNIIFEAATKFIKRDGYEKYQHHFLYKIPFLRVNTLWR